MPDTAKATPEASLSGSPPQSIVIEPGIFARNAWLFRRAFIAAYEDNCFGIAKGAAYSFFFSLFPILTTLTAILIQANAQAVVHVLATFVQQIVPPGTEDLVLSRLRDRGTRHFSLPIAPVLLSLWAGSGAMISLMEGFEAAYRIPSSRHFLKERAMALFLMLIAAIPTVGASSLILFGNRLEGAVIHWIGVADISTPVEIAWRAARYIVAFSTTILVTGLLFYFGPNYRPEPKRMDAATSSRFMRVWPGAFLSAVLWLLATVAFAWYVAHIANYNLFYGSMGTVIVLLIWLYLIACIALIGCEFNAERERIDSIAIPH